MSSVGSSVGNMPPRHGKKLADVMEDAFKNNSKQADDVRMEKAASDPPRNEAPTPAGPADSLLSAPAPAKATPARKGEGYTFQVTSVYLQPCERCIRSKKTCRGVEGARCEHCKSLHQKCSNSTGPPRGRHAGKSFALRSSYHLTDWWPLLALTAVRQSGESGVAGPSGDPMRLKRRPFPSKNGDDDEDDDDDDGEEGRPGPPRKKRRAGDWQGNALQDIAELEGAIKKLQTSVAKDLAKLSQLASSLATQVRGMES
ncbi:hypothetical protein DXG03_003489 [Asterophora parasitica]|uniref:Zn(2)-C6 fungal-type domain-containing protein n=1 Tax=Asterophora parasitica TaxID=117018 RepID=A0A9P7KEI7_9AGAR|nr:hypothetical protein DXG03_003489 [Asterophora parasitica]